MTVTLKFGVAASVLIFGTASTGFMPVSALAQTTAQTETRSPTLFDAEISRATKFVDGMIKAGVTVPLPKDTGGGYTHEQHKKNYRAIAEAGELFRITGQPKCFDFVREMLIAYADMYPKLGPHPARSKTQQYGRLFWQNLNDAVWLVNAIQGYEDIRPKLNEADRTKIDGP
jgi:oligo-alginate lyase